MLKIVNNTASSLFYYFAQTLSYLHMTEQWVNFIQSLF